MALVIGLGMGAALVGTALYYRRSPQVAPQGHSKAQAKGASAVVPTKGAGAGPGKRSEAGARGGSTGVRVTHNPVDAANHDLEVAIAVQCHGTCMECGCVSMLREDPDEPGAMYCKE